MINQFSASLDIIQDRVFFCFNTKKEQEFRLWLTRRCVSQFLETLPRYSEESKDIINELEKSVELKKKSLSNINKKESNKDDPQKNYGGNEEKKKAETKPKSGNAKGKYFAIGEDPILVKTIESQLIESSQKLVFHLTNNKNINCVVSLNTFLSLHSLLEMTSQKAGWNIENKDFDFRKNNILLN